MLGPAGTPCCLLAAGKGSWRPSGSRTAPREGAEGWAWGQETLRSKVGGKESPASEGRRHRQDEARVPDRRREARVEAPGGAG